MSEETHGSVEAAVPLPVNEIVAPVKTEESPEIVGFALAVPETAIF